MTELEDFAQCYNCPPVARALRMILLDYLGRYAASGYAFEVIETLPAIIMLIDIIEYIEPPADLKAPQV